MQNYVVGVVSRNVRFVKDLKIGYVVPNMIWVGHTERNRLYNVLEAYCFH